MGSNLTLKLRPLSSARMMCSAVCKLKLSTCLHVGCTAHTYDHMLPARLKLIWRAAEGIKEVIIDGTLQADKSWHFDKSLAVLQPPDAVFLFCGEQPIAAAGCRGTNPEELLRSQTAPQTAAANEPDSFACQEPELEEAIKEEPPEVQTAETEVSTLPETAPPEDVSSSFVVSSPEVIETEPAPAYALPPEIDDLSADQLPVIMQHAPEVSPFVGLLPGARFVSVATGLNLEDGFDHYIVGHIPLGDSGFYMLGIPAGSSWQPPAHLPEFRHYIPCAESGGYWVKYMDIP